MTPSAGHYGTSDSIDTGSGVHGDEAANTQLTATTSQARLLDDDQEQVSDHSSESQAHLERRLGIASNSGVDHELAGLGALEDGRPGERPAYPFTTLIRYAIKGSPKGRLLLEEIYQAIQSRYPFFATAPAGWKNSVRHTLSLMTCFEKVPRLLTEPGKGSYWTVNDSMPHAKPSRVRVRKRKTRTEDNDSTFGTPLSTPDTFPPEMETAGIPINADYYRGPPSGWPEGFSRRHSLYAQSDLDDRRVVYRTRSQESFRYDGNSQYHGTGSAHTPEYRIHGQRMLEPPPDAAYGLNTRSRWDDRASEPESDRAAASVQPSEGPAPADPIDYRLVLMSELERLRNVIGRRQDIDREWCRLMVERLRGTGLDF
ncbi:hypothetical protein FRC08_001486 [Ceratobasidium sp. 394]|nr:hypothetical protein FRC08_001486 [Ceratobasidium sp. 394]KAG9102437.1 hypothetical protein FS749_000028 [Ceratobasidium sp. UAMH 11750]